MSFAFYASCLVAFIGIYAGIYISYHAKEEMKKGKQYFRLIQKLAFVACLAVTLSFFSVPMLFKIFIYVLVFGVMLFKTPNMYPVLAIFFFFLGQSSDSLASMSILIMLYSIAVGSYFFAQSLSVRVALKKSTLYAAPFLFIALGLEIFYQIFFLKISML